MEAPVLLSCQIGSLDYTKETLNEQSQVALSHLLLPVCLFSTCVYAPVVLQVSSSGELLATVLLLADERLLAVVSPHVDLQPLQHVEAFPAALRSAPEHSVVPGGGENHIKTGLGVCNSRPPGQTEQPQVDFLHCC